MPTGPALSAAHRRCAALALLVAATVAAGGCAQPGSQAPRAEAARIGTATNDISTACGYAEELTAFGGANPTGLASVQAMARTGARALAAVYATDTSRLYQGESVGGIVKDGVSLLGSCGLPGPRAVLQRALQASH